MTQSDFYPTNLSAVQEMLSKTRLGEVKEIGRSAGGRPLWAVAYGEKEPIIVGDSVLPESYNRRQYYLDGFCRQLLRERLGIHRPWTTPGTEGTLTLDSAYFHLCGALPLLFEGAHGAQEGNRYTHEQIVDTYLTVFEGLMTVGGREGFKP